MPKAQQQLAFMTAVDSKMNELIEWVIDNRPNKDHELHHEDFSEAREKFRTIACALDPQQTEPEPSEGGAQYVNVTPAPWP